MITIMKQNSIPKMISAFCESISSHVVLIRTLPEVEWCRSFWKLTNNTDHAGNVLKTTKMVICYHTLLKM